MGVMKTLNRAFDAAAVDALLAAVDTDRDGRVQVEVWLAWVFSVEHGMPLVQQIDIKVEPSLAPKADEQSLEDSVKAWAQHSIFLLLREKSYLKTFRTRMSPMCCESGPSSTTPWISSSP